MAFWRKRVKPGDARRLPRLPRLQHHRGVRNWAAQPPSEPCDLR
ncbi:MAG: hypothetical protein ACTSUE_21845 [Promethearchaeota archaeon]